MDAWRSSGGLPAHDVSPPQAAVCCCCAAAATAAATAFKMTDSEHKSVLEQLSRLEKKIDQLSANSLGKGPKVLKTEDIGKQRNAKAKSQKGSSAQDDPSPEKVDKVELATARAFQLATARSMKSAKVQDAPPGTESGVPTLNRRNSSFGFARAENQDALEVGDEAHVSVEAVHDRQRPWYIISQFSRQKAVLNLVVLVLSVASGIIAPLQVAFPAMFAGVEWRRYFVVVDILFLLELVSGFFTSYTDKKQDKQVYDLHLTVFNYLSSWFTLDAASSIPFSLISWHESGDEAEASAGTNINKMLRMLKLLKLMRLLRAKRGLQWLNMYLPQP